MWWFSEWIDVRFCKQRDMSFNTTMFAAVGLGCTCTELCQTPSWAKLPQDNNSRMDAVVWCLIFSRWEFTVIIFICKYMFTMRGAAQQSGDSWHDAWNWWLPNQSHSKPQNKHHPWQWPWKGKPMLSFNQLFCTLTASFGLCFRCLVTSSSTVQAELYFHWPHRKMPHFC